MKQHLFLIIAVIIGLNSCTPTPTDVQTSAELPPIYPDYTDVTIPVNIAPLNFLVRGADAVCVEAGDITINGNDGEVVFSESEWHRLLAGHHDITVKVTARINGQWTAYKPFLWHVVDDKLDPWLTYRLIEPDYEVWNNIQLKQRCIENFDEAVLTDYRLQENRCMNCHTTGSQNPDLSMLYVRGKGGGAILNQNGRLRKLNIKTDDMVSGSVYFGFSPSGRYITFSTNIIIPAFHSKKEKRLEVYDTKSDVYVADLQENRIIRSPLLNDSTVLETFPTFSPDGKYIYYCAAPLVQLPQELEKLQYSLVRIPFDEQTGTLGTRVDTVFYAATMSQQSQPQQSQPRQPQAGAKRSVCHPRISPDGQHLLFTVQAYGTFPIWHRESDLRMMNLKTGEIDTLAVVNSDKSDTYHAWSSNSRWFVFASKRDDGLYGKPYFCYVDKNGRAHKPFCLPQRSPTFYDTYLKSFNAPELSRGRIPFDAKDVQRAMSQDAEPFK
ncbi:MAG: PD40 domain-containing protein [Prevotella sp.]|nr:PD40 domain-containing protein [Prevotella sp.]